MLGTEYPLFETLTRWLQLCRLPSSQAGPRKKALRSDDPTFDAAPANFDQRIGPALRGLLAAAASADEIAAETLLRAVASL